MPFAKGNTLSKGRPKSNNTKQSEALKEYLIEQVIKEKKPLIAALIKRGKAGDVSAIRDIFDRILGRAKESVDLTSGGEKITGIEYVVPKNETPSPTNT